MENLWLAARNVFDAGYLRPIPKVVGTSPVALAATWRPIASAALFAYRDEEGSYLIVAVISSRDPQGLWVEPTSYSGYGVDREPNPYKWFDPAPRAYEGSRQYASVAHPDGLFEACCINLHCPEGATSVSAEDSYGNYTAEVSPIGLALLISPVGEASTATVSYRGSGATENLSFTIEDSETDGSFGVVNWGA